MGQPIRTLCSEQKKTIVRKKYLWLFGTDHLSCSEQPEPNSIFGTGCSDLKHGSWTFPNSSAFVFLEQAVWNTKVEVFRTSEQSSFRVPNNLLQIMFSTKAELCRTGCWEQPVRNTMVKLFRRGCSEQPVWNTKAKLFRTACSEHEF